jgi:hypothetical protein
MTFLALGVAGYAFAALRPGFPGPLVQAIAATRRIAMYGHFAGGGVALAVGALQASAWLRARSIALHRWLGRIYVFAVLVGGTTGLRLAFESQGGGVAHAGFGLLGLAWLATTLIAYRLIHRGDQAGHRDWAIRSYALTFAAVTLRLYVPLSALAGASFETVYPAIAWLCWVPNLMFVELFLVSRRLGAVRA